MHATPSLRLSARVLSLLLLLLLGGATRALAQTTLTAQSAGPNLRFPNVSNDFEHTGATAANPVLLAPTWSPWTFNANAGIAHETATVCGTLLAPSNDRVALLQGNGAMSASCVVGLWRLRFKAAQGQTGNSHQVVQVLVGATLVFEGAPSATGYEEYVTRPFKLTASTTVEFRGMSTSTSDIALLDVPVREPLADWNATSTWLPTPTNDPASGNAIVIPDGVEVVLTGTATALSVSVAGELLAIPADITLDTQWIEVSGAHARFEVGQDLAPFLQNFTLTLLGDTQAMHSPHAGTKFLMAMDGGTIDMHGSQKTSWTRLTSLSAPAGQPSQITVLERDNWAVGDEIVIAPTVHVSHMQSASGVCTSIPPTSERRTITAIHAATGVITLSGSSLTPANHGTWSPLPYNSGVNSWMLEQRAEVGMLTRNVRIRGSVAANGFGGHVMIMACCTAMAVGLGHFANVELSNMGQKQVLGRYPIHWHMVRNERPGQYIRNSSIHDSNNRAITVHGSHAIHVADNVCYATMGHAVFLEDGVERDNVFDHNLVLATYKPALCEQMLPHDNSFDIAQNRSPSAFWISNPANHFINNVAADSFGTGYWFAIHTGITGLSNSQTWKPLFTFNGTTENLGTFADNSAHSLKMGIDVHDSVLSGVGAKTPVDPCTSSPPMACPPVVPPGQPDDPRDDDVQPNIQWQPTQVAVLNGFTAYGCTTGIYTGGGIEYTQNVVFDNCVLADNGAQVQFASADKIQNSLFVHDSGHSIFPSNAGQPGSMIQGFEAGCAYVAYDGPGQMASCHFVGYDGTSATARIVYDQFGAARRHPNHLFSNLTFAGMALPGSWFPALQYRDFAALYPPPAHTHPDAAFAQPFVWGLVIRDLTGSFSSGGVPPNLSYAAQLPHSLVTNHPMMHLTNGGSGTPDLPIFPTSTHAWLSPFRWAHLQVRYYEPQGNPVPNQPYYSDYRHIFNALPTSFVRQAYLGWVSMPFLSDFPQTVMRQMPVIVRPAGETVHECVYEVQLGVGPTDPILPGRADISIDDAGPGEVAHLLITHALNTGWTPTLYVNDDLATIHGNGQLPSQNLPIVPPIMTDPPTYTSWAPATLNNAAAIDLWMVLPAGSRTHRITIVW